MRAVVLLADVRGSRELEGRQDLSREMRRQLQEVNQRHESAFVAPLEFQKGVDELGAVLEAGSEGARVLTEAWIALHPVEARFSLVYGELDVVPEGEETSIRLFDGPAIHEASRSIEEMKRTGTLVDLRMGSDDRSDRRLSLLASLLYLRILEWTPRQLELYLAYRRMGSQKEVADHFEIAQPSVSEALAKARASFVDRALEFFIEDAGEAFQGAARA